MNTIILNDKTIQPSKIICIGRNYVDHINELNNETPTEPVIFMKPNSAISDEIDINGGDEIHYEAEISFVIDNGVLAAVGIGLDLTKRHIQYRLKAKGLPWERAKAFNGSAVFSDFVEFDGDTDKLRLELWINGELIQSGGVELMLHKPEEILHEVNSFSTLVTDDVLMTGTPAGVGVVNSGDVFVGKVYNKDTLLVEKNWYIKS